MFNEYRRSGNDPSGWTKNFLGDGLTTLPRLAPWRMSVDPCWREISSRVPRGARVLDAGCGLGAWVRFLSSMGYRGVGLDYSREMIELLQQRAPECEWLLGDIRAMPVADGAFDAVVSWGVVEHDEAGPDAALRDFYRVLRPGGWAFVTVPLESPNSRASSESQFGAQRADGNFFQYFFSEWEFCDALQRNGLQVERVTPISPHYALLYPSLYSRVMRAPPLARRAASLVLGTVAQARRDACGMVLAVARRPVAPR